MRKRNRFWLMVSVLFFGSMLLLTFTARQIHNLQLPQVQVGYLEQKLFPIALGDAKEQGLRSGLALAKELTEKPVYVIYEAEKNREMRTFVRQVQPITGVEREGYLEVLDGIGYRDRVVLRSSIDLWDGAEVSIEK